MISHRNVIANTLQIALYEKKDRETLKTPGSQSSFVDVALCLLPQSHIFALVVICHAGPYRGDQTVVLPKFELGLCLSVIQNFKISSLFLVSFLLGGRSAATALTMRL
jgi:acyl-CoA synthetase (AMP-forming)/AMP-acid ligase II